MAVNLTQGAIARICSHNVSDYRGLMPVLQVIDCVSHKLLLSDGSHCSREILAGDLKESFISRILHKGCLVKLIHFVVEQDQNITLVCFCVCLNLIRFKYNFSLCNMFLVHSPLTKNNNRKQEI